jgi:uncharacterized protein (DUF362 family)
MSEQHRPEGRIERNRGDCGRRTAIKTVAAGMVGLAGAAWGNGGRGLLAGSGSPEKRSPAARVAVARRKGLLGPKGTPDAGKLQDALGGAVARAAGEEGPVEAMRALFKPGDVVGIKVNCLAGRGLSPHPALVARLTRWLQEAGVAPRNIVIWERSDRELKAAGFSVARKGAGVRCFGTNGEYDWTPREWGAGGSCFARILTEDLTALINVGVLKDHDLAGVSVGLKNWYGVVHNPNKFHDNGCDPYVAELAAYPLIRKRLKLTVVDGSVAQCHGGPARSPRWTWPWEGILASTDPVAIDAVGWSLIEDRRKEKKLASLAEQNREPKWLSTASGLGLGESDPERIGVEEV